jgi:hypothetical protein
MKHTCALNHLGLDMGSQQTCQVVLFRFPLMGTVPGLPLRDATHDNTVRGGGSGYADN